MAVIRNATFEAAVDQYCNANDDWMGDDELPFVSALFYIARQLDKASNSTRGLPTGLTQEYRMQFVELHKHKPVRDGEPKKDALDEALAKIFEGDSSE